MNMMLIKTAKATAFLLLFAVVAIMLTIPTLAFSETYGATDGEESNGFIAIGGPVDVVLVTNGVEENYTYFPVECSDFLAYAGVSLTEIDTINVPGDMVLYDNMMIDVATVEYEQLIVEEVIDYGYDVVEVDTVPKGEQKVITEGVPGKKLVTYLQKKVDGVVADTEIIAEEILAFPVNGSAELGIGGTVTASDGTVYNYSYKRLMEATAYTYIPGKTTWTTATGARLDKGIVAVDPREIPMHTKMYIASSTFEYGYGVAEDTGGLIKGNIIDLAFLTVEECINFGRRNIWVYFLED